MQAVVVLAARDRQRIEAVSQPAEAVVVVAWERLLEPAHIHPLELARDLQRERKPPIAMAAVARLDPGLIGVDHDLDPVADRGPDSLDYFQVFAWVFEVESKLDRPVALGEHSPHVLDPLLGWSDLGARA